MEKEYSMTIDTSNMEAMQSIADDLGIPVYFDESFELVGDRYCQVFSDTVEGARKLQAVYNEKVRKLHSRQCYKDF